MTSQRKETGEASPLAHFCQSLVEGKLNRRHVFKQWELELLFDLQTYRVRPSARRELLDRYQRAVQKHLAAGGTAPFRLAQFMEVNARRRNPGSSPETGTSVSTAFAGLTA